jgi:hypothetical protein
VADDRRDDDERDHHCADDQLSRGDRAACRSRGRLVPVACRRLLGAGCAQLFPAAGLAGAAVLATVGTVWFAALRGTEPPPARAGRRGGPQATATPGLRVLVGVFALTGVIFGAIEVAMVAFATGHGARAFAGPLLAAYAGGSLLAGLWYGARDWRAPAGRRVLTALAALAAGTVLFAAAATIPQMAAVALVAGAPSHPR